MRLRECPGIDRRRGDILETERSVSLLGGHAMMGSEPTTFETPAHFALVIFITSPWPTTDTEFVDAAAGFVRRATAADSLGAQDPSKAARAPTEGRLALTRPSTATDSCSLTNRIGHVSAPSHLFRGSIRSSAPALGQGVVGSQSIEAAMILIVRIPRPLRGFEPMLPQARIQLRA